MLFGDESDPNLCPRDLPHVEQRAHHLGHFLRRTSHAWSALNNETFALVHYLCLWEMGQCLWEMEDRQRQPARARDTYLSLHPIALARPWVVILLGHYWYESHLITTHERHEHTGCMPALLLHCDVFLTVTASVLTVTASLPSCAWPTDWSETGW
jgi:hypothetical protein